MADELNGYGSGPRKSPGEWNSTFINWKNSTKYKARTLHAHAGKTGGGSPEKKQLSAIEERALSLWGMETIIGNPIGEFGLNAGIVFSS